MYKLIIQLLVVTVSAAHINTTSYQPSKMKSITPMLLLLPIILKASSVNPTSEISVEAGRSASWFSWWGRSSTNQEEPSIAISLQSEALNEGPYTYSWYNPISYIWRSETAASSETPASSSNSKDDQKEEEKRIVKRPRKAAPSLLSQVETLESFYGIQIQLKDLFCKFSLGRKNLAINPDVEKVRRISTFITKKRQQSSESCSTLADQVAAMARRRLKPQIEKADFKAERRVESLLNQSTYMTTRRNINSETKMLRAQLEKQYSNKGDLMTDLQWMLRQRRQLIDSQHSIESSGSVVDSSVSMNTKRAIVKATGPPPPPPKLNVGKKQSIRKQTSRSILPKKISRVDTSDLFDELKSKLRNKKKK